MWFIPSYEVDKLYRLVMRAMYVPFDALHLGLVEPHLRKLNSGGASPAAASPKMAFLDDVTETEFKVGHGTLGKHGSNFVPGSKVSFQGRLYAHALATHAAQRDVAYVLYNLNGQFVAFRALAALLDLTPGDAAASPAVFRAIADGKLLWTSAPIDRAGAGHLCTLDIRGVKTLRLEAHCTGDSTHQHAAWLNPLVSSNSEPPVPAFSRESHWLIEGTEFKFSETEKGVLLELVPGTSKAYAKIQIPLAKCGQSWAGVGDLYFKSSPSRRYEAKIEIPSEDIFSSKSLRVRTICPDAAAKTKVADITSTWTKKE